MSDFLNHIGIAVFFIHLAICIIVTIQENI
jgi:hypothetical protein